MQTNKGTIMSLKWSNTLDIAIALAEKYPNEDVQYIRFTDFLQYQHNNQKSAQKTKRPTHAHPTLSNIVINLNSI